MSQPDFDPIARAYRWLEYLTLGRALERCRERFLPDCLASRTALVLGDGDGRFTARLLAANPAVEVTAVDRSAAMLRLLASRAAASNASRRLSTLQADARTFTPLGTCDLIATHFFLDCLTQPETDALCLRLAPFLSPHGLWLVSEFRIPSGPLHWPARALVRALYLAFRALTGLRVARLPDHHAALSAAGLRLAARIPALGGLLTAELWRPEYTSAMLSPKPPTRFPDPVPDPEPPSPSLPEPDPGVFHHEPGTPTAPSPPANPPSLP